MIFYILTIPPTAELPGHVDVSNNNAFFGLAAFLANVDQIQFPHVIIFILNVSMYVNYISTMSIYMLNF